MKAVTMVNAQPITPFQAEVADRFGVLPNFFCTATAAPGLIEELWGFAKSAYLDSTLPPLFTERLFVQLSRFCEVRYCIVRHVGFLIGHGRPAGDADAMPESIEEVIALLSHPMPDAASLAASLDRLNAGEPADTLPEPRTQAEADLFNALTVIFVEPTRSERAREAVRAAVGDQTFELLAAYLAFVRTAHFWTETHPELAFEPDMIDLMERHDALRDLLLSPEEAEQVRAGGDLRRILEELYQTEAALRDSEERHRMMLLLVPALLWWADPTGQKIELSEGWNEYTGQTMAEVQNFGWLDAIHPDDLPAARAAFEHAFATGEPLEREHRVQKAGDGFRCHLVRHVPVRDADGAILHWFGAAIDIDERKRTEAALRESEKKYRRLFETMTEGFGICELVRDETGRAVDWRFLELNPALAQHTGMDPVASVGPLFSQLFPGADHSYWLGVYQRVVDTQTPQPFEDYWPPIDRWLAGEASPAGGEQFYIVYRDVTDRKRAELALRDNEERQTFLLKLSDALRPLHDADDIQRTAVRLLGEHLNVSRAGYYKVEADQNEFFLTARWERETVPLPDRMMITDFGEEIQAGYRAGRTMVARDTEQDAVSADNLAAVRAIRIRSWIGVPLVKDGRWVAAVGVHSIVPRNWTPAEIQLVEDVGERTWASVERARIETALRESEERLQLLVAELQHRVRNILTVVRSVFSRTVEAGGSPDDVADHFRGRLDALARTQTVITRNTERTADLENLIRDELLSVGVSDAANVTIAGPDVILSYKAAESLGLALHELTTNALKYGALKVPGARLAISWKVDVDQGKVTILDLIWSEQGVPAVDATPSRYGFGRELIEEALPYRLGAETKLEFRGGGVRCSITLALPANETDPSWRGGDGV